MYVIHTSKILIFMILFFLLSGNSIAAESVNTTVKNAISNDQKLIAIEERSTDKSKKEILQNLNIMLAFHLKVLSMLSSSHGYNKLVKFMPEILPIGSNDTPKKLRLVFSIKNSNIQQAEETFGQALVAESYPCCIGGAKHIAIVIYSNGVALFSKAKIATKDEFILHQMFLRALKKKIKIYICIRAMLNNGLIPPLMPPGLIPVPVGMIQIYYLIKHGYVYLP